MTIEGGALSRAKSCCGHAFGEHVWHYDRRIEGSDRAGASFCNTCGVFCGEKASTMVTRGAAFGSPWGMLGQFVKLSKDGARKPEPKRAAFAGLIDDLERASADRYSERALARSVQPSQPPGLVAGGAFDRMIDDLRREPARAASAPRTPAGPEPDPSEVVLMFEEDEQGRMQPCGTTSPRRRSRG